MTFDLFGELLANSSIDELENMKKCIDIRIEEIKSEEDF